MVVDEVIHEAVLEVDELGAVAAAATAAVMVGMAFAPRPEEPVVFHVDRPFLVILRHVRTGAIYLIARVLEP